MADDKRRKSASKPTSPRSLIRGAIGNKTSPIALRWALERAKNDAPIRDFARLYQLARLSPLLARAFPAAGQGVGANSIQSVAPLEHASFYREVAWAALTVLNASTLINAFVPLREQFYSYFLRGNYGQATLALNRVDRTCGPSLWSVENRIALLAFEGGFENQRPFVNALSARSGRGFVNFFAHHVSERNESRVSASGYERRLRDRTRTWSIKDGYRQYIFYRLLGELPTSLLSTANILAYEGASSAIDLYETLTLVLARVRGEQHLQVHAIQDALDALLEIEDHYLANLRVYYGQDNQVGLGLLQDYMTPFLLGEYEIAAGQVEHALAADVADPVAVVAACVLAVMQGRRLKSRSPVIDKIQELFIKLKGSETGASDAADELRKLARNVRHLPIADTVAQLLNERANTSLLPMAPLTSLRSSFHSPQTLAQLAWRPDEPAKSLDILAEAPAARLLATRYVRLQRTGELDDVERREVSAEANAYALGSFAAENGRYEEARKLFLVLRDSPHPYFREEAEIRNTWLLFADGQILDALREATEIAILRPGRARAVPLADIIRPRGFRDLKSAQSEPFLPIAFHLYGQLTDDPSKEVALKVAWRQFLRQHGAEKPSDLDKTADHFERTHFVYFLQNICVQEVMELGDAFSSPADLDNERLQVCLMLLRLDPLNAIGYEAEVLELTRRLAIEEGVRQVDSSRVYVDVVGIERWCQATLEESFLRYLDYVGAGLQESVEDLEQQLVQIARKGSKAREIEDFLESYDVSADSILQDVIETAATAFMTLPRYGLDAFLGSRVRHGSLEGIFRTRLESLNLVTKIDSRTREYEANEYWLGAIQFGDDAKRTNFGRILSNLSRSVDLILDNAVGRYVYVRSDANQDGLISLWHSEETKRQRLLWWVIQAKLTLAGQAEVTLSQFVSYCAYTLFWPALSTSLERVQRFATEDLTNALVKCLDDVEKGAEALVPSPQLVGFKTRLRAARAEVANAAAKLASWFHVPSEPSKRSSYSLKTAIEIGMRSTSIIWPNFNIDVVDWKVEEAANVTVLGEAYELINDVAYLIFGNIAKHSGYFDTGATSNRTPKVEIKIIRVSEQSIQVSVESPVASHVDLNGIRASVEKAKADIAARRYDEVVRKKRGTGLVRMATTLNYEGDDDRTLDFGLVDDARFFVRFSLPLYALTKEHSNGAA
ncbi:hypothetical protein RHDC3_03083 [Rhodocyclaceae bacterium]|nr:hypothetical protein RHDC3_03083 [Rhodocyclaceae bacterium]